MRHRSKSVEDRVAELALRKDDPEYWRERYEQAREDRDDAEFKLQELALQVTQWVNSTYGASDALMAMYQHLGQLRERPRPSARDGVVYYISQPRNRVKIGYTTSFVGRMQTLYAQPGDVLAVEVGTMELEAGRHRQFAGLRVGRTELFDLTPELEEHIRALRDAHDDSPWNVAVEVCKIRRE